MGSRFRGNDELFVELARMRVFARQEIGTTKFKNFIVQ
jgi:hypothetical protein